MNRNRNGSAEVAPTPTHPHETLPQPTHLRVHTDSPSPSRRGGRLLGPVLLIGLFTASPFNAPAAGQARARLSSPGLAAAARDVAVGGRLRIDLDDASIGDEPASLELRRFEVFSENATLLAHDPDGVSTLERPRLALFRGRLAGSGDSLAFLSVSEGGRVRGFVSSARGIHLLDAPAGGTALAVPVEMRSHGRLRQRMESWSCGADRLSSAGLPIATPISSSAGREPEASLVARLAIDTDVELLQHFGGSTDDATTYIGELVAAISAIYERDLGVSLEIGYLSFWTGGPGTDPYDATNGGALTEFQDFWRAQRGDVERTVAHLVSGKLVGLGVAYLGTLCSKNYGYGVSMGVTGAYDAGDPAPVWDIVVVSHEIGHNFGSPHTHCYVDSPNDGDPPVDTCFNGEDRAGCYLGGTLSLPPDGGTLMSYCHLNFPGGLSNINLLFGDPTGGDRYGVDSFRVIDRMRSTIAGADLAAPGCFLEAPDIPEPATPVDFDADGASESVVFESGEWISP